MAFSAFAQKEVDVLKLSKKRFFKETDTYTLSAPSTILCEVCYDDPRSFDEEYCKSVSIIIKDTAQFRDIKVYSIENDTSIIQCTYDRYAPWGSDEPGKKVSGTLKILKRTNDFIELEMNITVKANTIDFYKGKRKFKISSKE
jgi:hypothetical protein